MLARKKLKRVLGWLAVLVLVVLLAMAVRHRLGGRVQAPVLDSGQIARIDRIVLEHPDGQRFLFGKGSDGTWSIQVGGKGLSAVQADYSRVLDFLYVFNFWKIAWIPDEEEARDWKGLVRQQGGEVKLKAGSRTLLRFKFACRDGRFLIRYGSRCYAMDCVWKPSSWMSFFTADSRYWQSRLLMDFPSSDIRFVELRYASADSSRGPLFYRLDDFGPDSSLPSFSQVYFAALGDARMGDSLYTLTVGSKQGEVVRLSVFEKLVRDVPEFFFDTVSRAGGTTGLRPDIFQAVVVVERGAWTDTVQMPFVVLDKMTGAVSGFAASPSPRRLGSAK